jgi:alpha-tubulin suppressor-like RCC1 family protein
VAAGERHFLALDTNGRLWAWGDNIEGQIGDGTRDAVVLPKMVGSGYVAIAAGQRHSVALNESGTVWLGAATATLMAAPLLPTSSTATTPAR